MIRVNTIYGAVQGEGVQTGVPMVVLRLQGCAVGCLFCDTRETWECREDDYVSGIADAIGEDSLWTKMSPSEIAELIRAEYPSYRWVLLTGGEPADQDLTELVAALHGADLKIAIETSGTSDGHMGMAIDWVCVSPKIDMPGARPVMPAVLRAANEIKHVVGKQADLDQLEQLLAEYEIREDVEICLQPMSQSSSATELCVKAVQERGWRLSAQMHKYLELP